MYTPIPRGCFQNKHKHTQTRTHVPRWALLQNRHRNNGTGIVTEAQEQAQELGESTEARTAFGAEDKQGKECVSRYVMGMETNPLFLNGQ